MEHLRLMNHTRAEMASTVHPGVSMSCAAAIILGSLVAGGQEPTEPGRRAFRDAGCASCHGPSAQGATAPALAGTARAFPDFLRIVREGFDEMPAQSAAELSDEQVAIIHQWLVRLPGRSR